MATTQYIGARYVPLFSEPIDWDKTKSYEPLTIVYYAGNSYTSKQTVPAGIDISNTTFWALTGNYNAQIEQYRNEVNVVSKKLTTVEGIANNAQTGVNNLNKKFPIVESDISDNAITTSKIIDGAITTNKLADNAINTDKIVDNSITSSKLTSNCINSDNISAAAITTDKIAKSAITTDKISDASVTNSKIANNSINESKIYSNSITTSKLTTGAVTTDKISNASITGAKIATGAVSMNLLAPDVTSIINKVNSFIDNTKVCNVRDLGAVGDGTTDDTQAFYAAIGTKGNPADYDIVIIPSGDYVVSEWLYLHKNLIIIGPGHIINKAAQGGVFNWESSVTTENLYNCIIDGVEITSGTDSNGTILENVGIQVFDSDTDEERVYDFVIMNCNIHNMGSRGISIYSGNGTFGGTNHPTAKVVVANNRVNDCGLNCLHFLGSEITAYGNHLWKSGNGAEVVTFDDGCSNCAFIGNFVKWPGGGAGGLSCDELDGLRIIGNTFNNYDNTDLPCIRLNCGSGDCNNVVIVGNDCGGGKNGVSMGDDTKGFKANNVVVVGNLIRDNSAQPVWCSNNSRNISIYANCCTWNANDANYLVTSEILQVDGILNALFARK